MQERCRAIWFSTQTRYRRFRTLPVAEGEVQEPQEQSPPTEAAGAVAQVPPQEAQAAYLHSREI